MNMTIVIADDEKMALKNLEMLINREFPNLTITGMAEDGIGLKELLETQKPDLAIVDVRMPGLTGLEVMQLVKGKGNKTHFIVNTAYSDFEYVKSALDLKADGYILKPMKRPDMIKAVSNICQLVEDEKREEEKKMEMNSIMQSVGPTLSNQIVLSVCVDDPDENDFSAFCKYNSIHFTAGCVVTIMPVSGKSILLNGELHDHLIEVMQGLAYYLLTVTNQSVTVILLIPDEIEKSRRKAWCSEIAQLLFDEVCRTVDQRFVMGIGGVVEDFSTMSDSYHECQTQIKEQLIGEAYNEESDDHLDKYIDMAKSYIRRHFSEDISLSDCAQRLEISSCYLSRTYKQKTGETFLECLTGMRMNEAKRLCADESVPLKKIAEMCGYNNITYFYKVFKTYTGTSIGKYRKELQNVASK